ncbi:MAG TPA: sigma factor-like helix-turn-helix DNA-binding protein, partial [Candidatus Kapabacteria bacterium]|nr:sigma factor-like helix-turn-helix DNA-binding protein [Candidatus Kapabacteria bacterium]
DDLSYEEIGEVLEVPVTTVRNWVVRAKKKLRTILSPYMDKVRDTNPDKSY